MHFSLPPPVRHCHCYLPENCAAPWRPAGRPTYLNMGGRIVARGEVTAAALAVQRPSIRHARYVSSSPCLYRRRDADCLSKVTAPSITAASPCPASCMLGLAPWLGQWSTNSLAPPIATTSFVVNQYGGAPSTSIDCNRDLFSTRYLSAPSAQTGVDYSLDESCNVVASVSDGPDVPAVVM